MRFIMRRTNLSVAMSLMVVTHTLLSDALVAGNSRGSVFSIDIVPTPAKQPINFLGTREPDDHAAQSGSVVSDLNGAQTGFYSPVTIGNQTFQMILDTGSADLWVYSNQSSKKQNQGHAIYAPTSSATLLQNYTWEIRYSSSTGASGIVYRDDVRLGTVVAEGQAVEAATNIPFAFGPDGIMGLGSGKINQVKPEKQKTFFETVAPTLQRKLFAAAFVADGPGAWDFGYLNESRYSGDVVYTPNVQPDKYWTMAVGRYAVGNSTLGHKSIGHAIVDSGSTNVNLPEAIVKHYYSQVPTAKPIPGSGDTDYYFPCNTTLPDFHFQVENTTFTLTGDMINDSVFYADQCIGLLHTNTQTKHTILGNTFMKHFYVVFSAEDDSLKLGLAVRSDQK